MLPTVKKQYRIGREKWDRLNRLADTRAAGLERERGLAEGASWANLHAQITKNRSNYISAHGKVRSEAVTA